MRWLVPTAAATSRSDRSPMPPTANSSTTASSSSWRRSRSRGRAIEVMQMLASALETLGLQFEIAPCHPAHEQADHGTDGTTLIDLLTNAGAVRGDGSDVVAGHRQPAGRALHPGPRL